jgi:hypothetical protein
MMKRFLLLPLILLTCTPSLAADRVTCYTLWDDYFFYAAFEVQDPDVISTNTTHMSNPWEDDCMEVFLETDAKRAQDRTPNTYQMSVSAGGGSSFLVGENGQPRPKTIFTFKYAKKVQGTINRSYDKDLGYTIELAIPWKEMGGPPKVGQIMGFNAICRMKGENDGFVSLSPNVVSEADVQCPAKWGSIKFTNTPTIIAMDNGALVCRRVGSRGPVMDGNLSPGEWIRDMRVQMIKPEPIKKPERFMLEKLALARYLYWYQGDSRKAEPAGHVRNQDGSSALTDQPLDGTGPWFSYDRVQWHKDQLSRMRNAGIDVVLPVYQEGADKGLNCMVQALKELKAEGKSYPLVGMYLELNVAKITEIAYGAVKDFFQTVPDEFRAVVQTPVEKGGYPANILVVSAGSGEGYDEQFTKDSGRRLICVSEQPGDAKPALGISIAGISPGQDRVGGAAYRKSWDAAVAQQPDWIIIGWNNFQDGSEICPSVQYGESYVGPTKINMLRFNGMHPFDAKFLKHDTPQTMLPGAMYQVTLTVKNAGTKPWYAGEQGVFLTGRWFKEGTLYADTAIRLPLQETVLAGQIIRKTIGIRTVDQDGKALPPGDYELRWEMVRGHDEWFAGDTPLCVPVKVGDPQPGFTLVSSTLPTLMKSGAAYKVTVRVRNDGPTAWKAGWKLEPSGSESPVVPQTDLEPGRIADITFAVLAQKDGLLQWGVSDGEKSLPAQGARVATEAVKITSTDYGPRFMTSDTPPEMNAGKRHEVNLTLANTGVETWTKAEYAVGYHWYSLDGHEVLWDGAKTPLPADVPPGGQVAVKASVTAPTYDGQYYLVWDLAHGDTWASTTANTRGSDILVVPVNVIKGSLVAMDLSKLFDADVISNDTNRKDGDAGGGLTLPAEFLPPLLSETPTDGKLWTSGLWTSLNGRDPSTRISFLYPSKLDGAKNAITCSGQTINVKSGKYSTVHFLILATEKTSGQFALNGQVVGLRPMIQFSPWSEPALPLAEQITDTAFVCPHRHSPDGDQNQPCYLTHYAAPAIANADLTSITLPNNPALKVMAITLEKAQ